jgi:hypothetical protein
MATYSMEIVAVASRDDFLFQKAAQNRQQRTVKLR